MAEPGPRRFRAALARGRPLLLDAAMGTRLVARGLDLARDDPCLWTLDRPDDVLAVHRRDVAAGSDALLTNTFGANRRTLARLGRPDAVVEINRRAVALARQAAGADRFVLGSIGPQAVDDVDATREQVLALTEAGADALLLETHTRHEARTRLELLRGEVAPPVVVSIIETGELPGKPAGWAKGQAWADSWLGRKGGACAYGTNCHDLEATLRLIERLAHDASAPLIAQPSAGLPGPPLAGPEAFAAAVPRLLALGVRLLGGCCGTTEAHVAALRAALDRVPVAQASDNADAIRSPLPEGEGSGQYR
ncbi:MAG TPA: homocysteine S-methyltransferase family protein [Isosphaeraceae bacterium]|jgi:methionine synthase I (cobalamin-dependent)